MPRFEDYAERNIVEDIKFAGEIVNKNGLEVVKALAQGSVARDMLNIQPS